MGQRLTDKTALTQQVGSGDLLMVVDVNDTTGSAEGTSKKMDFKYLLQTDKISLSNAEVQALNTTSKTLVGALSGYMITPITCTMIVTYASATESSNNSLLIGYDDSTTSYAWWSGGRFFNASTTDRTYAMVSTNSITDTASIINKPFIMWSSGAFNGGWTADIYVTYCYTKVL